MKLCLMLAAMLFVGAPAWAQTDTRAVTRSFGLSRVPCGPKYLPRNDDFCMYFNGYHWKNLDDLERSSYIVAYGHGVRFTLMDLLSGTDGSDFRRMFTRLVGPFELEETKAMLDTIYGTPENLGLPISYALQLIAGKGAGKTEVELRKQAEDFRRLVVGPR